MTVAIPAARWNWFLLFGLPLSFVIHITLRKRKLSAIAGSVFLVLGFMLEVYVGRGCANSQPFHERTEQIAYDTYVALHTLDKSYWLMFGNILFALRGASGIPKSDTDSDVGVENMSKATFEELEILLSQYYLNWNMERSLIQIYYSQDMWGPHSDIWVYSRSTDRPVLYNSDYSIRSNILKVEDVYPLKTIRYLGLDNVTLPHHAHVLAKAEYGESYMVPLTTRLECMENVLNRFCFYKDTRNWIWNMCIGTIAMGGTFWALVPGIQALENALWQKKMYLPVKRSA